MSASGRERIAALALAVLAPVLFWGLLAHPSRRLLVVLGGSSVAGYPAGRPSFAAKLEKRLNDATPRRWRVANRGLPCKGSFYVEGCAQRALDWPARASAATSSETRATATRSIRTTAPTS